VLGFPDEQEDSPVWQVYAKILRFLVYAMAALAGAGILTMIAVTAIEVLCRIAKISLTGVYDIVKIAGGLSMASALPYTTACKGHVAIEYFFHKLSRRGRIVVDSLTRITVFVLFAFFAVQTFKYGLSLQRSGQVSPTLELPDYYVAYVLAFACALVCFIKVYHLFHPGRELIKP